MKEEVFNKLYVEILQLLREKLPVNLHYHCPDHTLDVLSAVERIALSEGCNPKEILLLKTAALFHDTGYVIDMRDHEVHGCELATEKLKAYKVSAKDIEIICGLIMATKVPQEPKNKLQEIICDADLDYLGRDDYFTIADSLFREYLAFHKVESERDWMELQVKFLQSHKYFTETSIQTRRHKEALNLLKIKEAVAG